MKKYTIIINTYPHETREEDLTKCLKSISNQSFKDFNVLIVENSENKEEPLNIAKKCNIDEVEVICDKTKKLSYLFNVGWKNTQTERLAYIADDAEATDDWLSNIDKELNENETTGVVTGPIISTCYPAGEMHRLYLISQKNWLTKLVTWPYMHFVLENNPLAPGLLFNSGAYSLGAGLEESKKYSRQEIDLATTSSMGIRKVCLEKINGFDENFLFNHADGDLFIRIKKEGWKIIFDPKVIAYHNVRLGPSRNAYNIGRDTGLFYKKHIKIKSVATILGILMNLTVLNGYWVYNTLRTRDAKQLKGILGFFEGIIK